MNEIEPYVPTVIDYEDSGYSEFILYDAAVVYEDVPGMNYRVMRDMMNGNIVGFAWVTTELPGSLA